MILPCKLVEDLALVLKGEHGLRKSMRLWLSVVGLSALALMMAACGGNQAGSEDSGSGDAGGGGNAEMAQSINGAGASFPAPVYNKMFQELASNDGPQVNYQSVGSGAGIENFINKSVAFGASDAPMSEEEMQAAGGNPMHIATVGGPVVAAYNIQGVDSLNLTGQVLADIFLGNITNWSDPAIVQLNPDANLPDAEITVVHRSDSSGTSNIFTSYLAAVSPEWKSGPGAGKSLDWPVGIGAKGNEGVAGQVQRTDNAIGYVGYEYAASTDIPTAAIGTQETGFTEPSVDSAKAAIAQAEIPEDLRVTISATNPQGEGVYPITGLTWLLVRQQQDDLAQCKAVAETAWYTTHEGQEFAPDLNYAQIPDKVVSQDEQFIKNMEANGTKCYEG